MRLKFDPESGAIYIRVREGELEETLDLAQSGSCPFMDIYCEGSVLG